MEDDTHVTIQRIAQTAVEELISENPKLHHLISLAMLLLEDSKFSLEAKLAKQFDEITTLKIENERLSELAKTQLQKITMLEEMNARLTYRNQNPQELPVEVIEGPGPIYYDDKAQYLYSKKTKKFHPNEGGEA